MSLPACGAPISNCEVTTVTAQGFWLLVEGRELFVSFAHYPVFSAVPVNKIFAVTFHPPEHLSWPELDIDIELPALQCPDQFPLIYSAAAAG